MGGAGEAVGEAMGEAVGEVSWSAHAAVAAAAQLNQRVEVLHASEHEAAADVDRSGVVRRHVGEGRERRCLHRTLAVLDPNTPRDACRDAESWVLLPSSPPPPTPPQWQQRRRRRQAAAAAAQVKRPLLPPKRLPASLLATKVFETFRNRYSVSNVFWALGAV